MPRNTTVHTSAYIVSTILSCPRIIFTISASSTVTPSCIAKCGLVSHAPAFQHHASFVPPPRHDLLLHILAQTSSAPPRIETASISQFLPTPQAFLGAQPGTALLFSVPASQHFASFVPPPRRNLSHLPAVQASSPPVWTPPHLAGAFQQVRTTPSVAQACTATSKIKVLSHAVECL